ncbi:MAG: mycothiol-dependent nitroreductase Rv2466c family protein, partial [Streptosporangiaceae bacterium]
MADVDFFFDPVCPSAWLTSRWVAEVARQKDLAVNWRFISLRILNEHRDYATEFPAGYPESHGRGLRLLRVAAAVREQAGPEPIGGLYEAFGRTIHVEEAATKLDGPDQVGAVLTALGLDPALAGALDDERHDAVLREETELALTRAGSDVGTPVLTFAPPDGPSFFGPVISRAPEGAEAVRLWESVEFLARFGGFAELKRTRIPLATLVAPVARAARGRAGTGYRSCGASRSDRVGACRP